MPSRSEKSKQIDALRGVAIVAVVMFHYVSTTGLDLWLRLPLLVNKAFAYGWAGVDLFFVLSSFLLARNLLLRQGTPGAATTFYRRRLFRIAPMYLFLLVFSFALSIAIQSDSLVEGLAPFWVYVTFLQNFWFGFHNTWGGQVLAPTWSLAVEEHFYLFLPLMMLRLSRRSVFYVAIAFIISAPLLREVVFLKFNVMASSVWTICRLDSLGWGLLIALSSTLENTTRLRLAVFWLVDLAFAVAWATIRAATDDHDCSATLTITTILAAGAVYLVSFERAGIVQSRALVTAFVNGLAFLGERCFSIYLLHIPVLGLVARATHTNVMVDSALSAIVPVISFGLTLRFAHLTYRSIERPFMDYANAKAPATVTAPRPAAAGA